MRLVGLRSILTLLPTLALACAAPSPGAPEQAQDAVAPAAKEQAAAGPAVIEVIEVSQPGTEAEPASEAARADSLDADAPARSPAPTPERIGGEADRSQSRLDIAVQSINGGLNRDIIRRIASTHADDIRDCHGRALASMPNLAGKLVVELWLDERGRVTNAELTGPMNDHVGQCMVTLVMGWTFPDAGEGSFELAFDFNVE